MGVRTVVCTVAAVGGLVLAGAAQAHLLYASGGLSAGFAHPLLGWDHLLAMVAVGLWAAQLGGRALWALPLTFVSVMAGGALLSMNGVALPHVEAGIAASLLALGLLLAFAARLPLTVGVTLVATFALFHGHAHGAELPAMISAWGYAAGFVVATLLLHVTGIAIGRAVHANGMRIAGACMVLLSLSLFAGI